MAKAPDVSKLKRALMRSNTRLLLSAVLLFQFAACLLLALKTQPLDTQALLFAAAIPLTTYLFSTLITRLWPVDRAIIILTLLLCSIGIITLKAIAKSPTTPGTQAEYALLGLVAMVLGMGFIRLMRSPGKKLTLAMMALCLLALMTPWVLGSWKDGARNWILLFGGRISLQPSEFMKPVFLLVLASGMSNRPRFLRTLPTLAFAAACCGILLSQRDLGALLIYFLSTVAVFSVATSNGFLTLAGLGMGAGAGYLAYRAMPYVQRRFAMWKNPWSDPENYGYQLVQALIAIGSGGLFGMGLGLGSPRDIPLYHSDFIFAALTEEFGLVFSVCLLILYVLIIMRGLIAAMNARTSFHSLAAFGVVAMLGLQTMLIVGGILKLLPLTGMNAPSILLRRLLPGQHLFRPGHARRQYVPEHGGRARTPSRSKSDRRRCYEGIAPQYAPGGRIDFPICLFTLLCAGYALTVYTQGAQWSSTAYNTRGNASGSLRGEITDRNGVTLAATDEDGSRVYPEDSATRRALSQVVGDTQGHVRRQRGNLPFRHPDEPFQQPHRPPQRIDLRRPPCGQQHGTDGGFPAAGLRVLHLPGGEKGRGVHRQL